MRIVYIAHAISSDVPGNLAKIREIMKLILTSGGHYHPIAPYLPLFDILDNSNPEHYKLGLESNRIYFERKFVDELWVFGEEMSRGVEQEIAWALENDIAVVFGSVKEDGRVMLLALSRSEAARHMKVD